MTSGNTSVQTAITSAASHLEDQQAEEVGVFLGDAIASVMRGEVSPETVILMTARALIGVDSALLQDGKRKLASCVGNTELDSQLPGYFQMNRDTLTGADRAAWLAVAASRHVSTQACEKTNGV
ncbi:hypothetical protein [Stenotrophomonas maltophilia]|uniref:hypothetical protein n=1 Tax=Stenotrophomonas maltophilia TaxID=40324 RepID=UPI00244C03DA|nr:hypothetical protein [Stenotrophomonas maltophilia]MDH0740916.1 hypothetical protein [Stenotrophomonas maltophilia]MDH1328352.1 hypothetical protein [Stenotrophomonas maltophilia]